MSQQSKPRKLDSIFSKCVRSGECLEWTGNYFQKKDGTKTYPYMYHTGKVWRGNRLVLFLVTGEIPNGMLALHKCDNKKCVNPVHLYWGTHKQNIADAYERKIARNSKITHCPRGHEYAGENLYQDKRGKRYCKTCLRMFQKLYAKRKLT